MDSAILSLLILNIVQFLTSIWLHIWTSKCKLSNCMEMSVDNEEEQKKETQK